MRLCMERVLPPCRERTVKFSLPPIEAARTGKSCGPSPRDVSLAMDAVTSALARGEITPGVAETIAAEWAMPDLDLIKQNGQVSGTGAVGSPGGWSDNTAGLPRGWCRHSCPGDRNNQQGWLSSQSAADFVGGR